MTEPVSAPALAAEPKARARARAAGQPKAKTADQPKAAGPPKARAKVPAPGYRLERELARAGAQTIAGLDEVGRGAWAGPVMVCAVVARAGFPRPPAGLTDSKRLTAKRRAELAGGLPGRGAASPLRAGR